MFQGVILPDRPVFLKWRNPPGKPLKTDTSSVATGSISSSELEVLPATPHVEQSLRPAGKKSVEGLTFISFCSSTEPIPNSIILEPTRKEGRKKKSILEKRPANKRHAVDNVNQYKSQMLIKRPPALFPFNISNTITTHHYINYYLHSIADSLYPLASHLLFNPIRDKLFQIAVTDEVWYYTVVYCAARQFVGQDEGFRSSQDATILMDMILRRLNQTVARARAGEGPPDTILCAIACLITLENGMNNHDACRIHADGMLELVKVRGGIEAIDKILRWKICRADAEEAVDSLKSPLLSPLRQAKISISALAGRGSCFLGHSSYSVLLSRLQPELATIAKDIIDISNSIEYAINRGILIDPVALDENAIFTLHRLLACDSSSLNGLENAFRLGAMIYMKAIIRPLSVIAVASNLLAKTIRDSIHNLEGHLTPLSIWAIFMALFASRVGSEERAWLVKRLAAHAKSSETQFWRWQDARNELEKILWIRPLFDRPSEALWQEVEFCANEEC